MFLCTLVCEHVCVCVLVFLFTPKSSAISSPWHAAGALMLEEH